MPTAIELLKGRLESAKAAKLAAEQKLREAQAALVEASRVVEIWNSAVILESRRNGNGPAEQLAAIEENSLRITHPGGPSMASILREAIQQHPEGITSTQLLKELRGKIRKSTYVYGILKRLRDNGQVEVKEDGRYVMKAAEEASTESRL